MSPAQAIPSISVTTPDQRLNTILQDKQNEARVISALAQIKPHFKSTHDDIDEEEDQPDEEGSEGSSKEDSSKEDSSAWSSSTSLSTDDNTCLMIESVRFSLS